MRKLRLRKAGNVSRVTCREQMAVWPHNPNSYPCRHIASLTHSNNALLCVLIVDISYLCNSKGQFCFKIDGTQGYPGFSVWIYFKCSVYFTEYDMPYRQISQWKKHQKVWPFGQATCWLVNLFLIVEFFSVHFFSFAVHWLWLLRWISLLKSFPEPK